ncbi:hypothetical protein [Novosphingobium terrae]|uniref:hypothetical protein n=1 Tax=Novosphingobium terrae TaxID=2726189 RepID=UPI0019823317|nr:hypothetical protein [Novosphingobium terrae]
MTVRRRMEAWSITAIAMVLRLTPDEADVIAAGIAQLAGAAWHGIVNLPILFNFLVQCFARSWRTLGLHTPGGGSRRIPRRLIHILRSTQTSLEAL